MGKYILFGCKRVQLLQLLLGFIAAVDLSGCKGQTFTFSDGENAIETTTHVGQNAQHTISYRGLQTPYGVELATWDKGNSREKYTFAGYRKEAGLGSEKFDLKARIYDARIGRFSGVDPVVHAHESAFAYSANNPINLTDPTGLCPDPPCAEEILQRGEQLRERFYQRIEDLHKLDPTGTKLINRQTESLAGAVRRLGFNILEKNPELAEDAVTRMVLYPNRMPAFSVEFKGLDVRPAHVFGALGHEAGGHATAMVQSGATKDRLYAEIYYLRHQLEKNLTPYPAQLQETNGGTFVLRRMDRLIRQLSATETSATQQVATAEVSTVAKTGINKIPTAGGLFVGIALEAFNNNAGAGEYNRATGFPWDYKGAELPPAGTQTVLPGVVVEANRYEPTNLLYPKQTKKDET